MRTIKQALEDAYSTGQGGMSAGLPKVTVDAAELLALVRRSEAQAKEIARLRALEAEPEVPPLTRVAADMDPEAPPPDETEPPPDAGLAREEPTLRDQFAMAALTGLLPEVRVQGHEYTLAISAYKIADAMLAVRLR